MTNAEMSSDECWERICRCWSKLPLNKCSYTNLEVLRDMHFLLTVEKFIETVDIHLSLVIQK